MRKLLASDGFLNLVKRARGKIGLPDEGLRPTKESVEAFGAAQAAMLLGASNVGSKAASGFSIGQADQVLRAAECLAQLLPVTPIAIFGLQSLIVFNKLPELFAERVALPGSSQEEQAQRREESGRNRQLRAGLPPNPSMVEILRHIRGKATLRPQPIDLDLVAFVNGQKAAWEERRRQWNRAHPENPYDSLDAMRVAHQTAKRRLNL